MLLESNRPGPSGTLLLTRLQVVELLDLGECIDAVEAAFREQAEGRAIPSGVLGAPVEGGGFHLKTAGLERPHPYFVAKLNGNFHANHERFDLPRIQGVVVLSDARNGYPLAIMDSAHLTGVRTAAATAVAARHLATADAGVVTICGCGLQGRAQLAALCRVRPVTAVYAVDSDPATARAFAADLAVELGISITPTEDLARAARRSQMIVTCTPSRRALLGPTDLSPGTFIAAVGADSEEKQELDPHLLQGATLVVDHLGQCSEIGELHHALVAGILSRSEVHGELHEIVSGRRSGRTSDSEIVIFDSTGVALEDVAAAALVFERARDSGIGTLFELV